jgi:hypothetical protein
LVWGCGNIAAAADTRFLSFGFGDSATADTTSSYAFRSPRAGTLRNLRVRHNAANGNGTSVVYTVRVAGVPTALTATLASGAVGDASNLIATVAVAAGDLIEVTAFKASSLGSGALNVAVACELG